MNAPEYPTTVTVRRVRHGGDIKGRGTLVFVSEALRGEPLGIAEVAEGCWHVHFGPLTLGCLHAGADQLLPPDA